MVLCYNLEKMSELGKIEKPSAESYKEGRKLYLVPLIYRAEEIESEYVVLFDKYWSQVEAQITNLESKLGPVRHIFHELVVSSGEGALNIVKELNEKVYGITKGKIEKGAELEATEDGEILTEFMDWSRCLSINLQNPRIISKIYDFYQESARKRLEFITKQIDGKIKANETAILFIREGIGIQFPADIQVFYVSPPALDELKRWLRDQQLKATQEKQTEAKPEPGTPSQPG